MKSLSQAVVSLKVHDPSLVEEVQPGKLAHSAIELLMFKQLSV